MKTQMTDRARELLAHYEADVRQSLAGRTDVDPEDVVAGIREHVDAALAGRRPGDQATGGPADVIAPEATPATAEEVADALERLGAPSAWVEAEATGGPLSTAGAGVADRWGAILAAFGLILLGGILLFTPRWGALGWGLLIAGTLVLRVAGLRESSQAPDAADRLALAWWWLAAGFGAVVLLVAPAVLAWGAAQTGGVLVQPLSALTEASAATRTGVLAGRSEAYWLAISTVAGLASGTWWVFVGLVLRRGGHLVRRALGPARRLSGPRVPRALLLGGAFLCGAALLSALPLLGWMSS